MTVKVLLACVWETLATQSKVVFPQETRFSRVRGGVSSTNRYEFTVNSSSKFSLVNCPLLDKHSGIKQKFSFTGEQHVGTMRRPSFIHQTEKQGVVSTNKQNWKSIYAKIYLDMSSLRTTFYRIE